MRTSGLLWMRISTDVEKTLKEVCFEILKRYNIAFKAGLAASWLNTN